MYGGLGPTACSCKTGSVSGPGICLEGEAQQLRTLCLLFCMVDWGRGQKLGNSHLGSGQRSTPRAQVTATKRVPAMEGLPTSKAKPIEKAMGRIQWATAVCPLLQLEDGAPLHRGEPPRVLRIEGALHNPIKQYSPHLPKSEWRGSEKKMGSQGVLGALRLSFQHTNQTLGAEATPAKLNTWVDEFMRSNYQIFLGNHRVKIDSYTPPKSPWPDSVKTCHRLPGATQGKGGGFTAK